MKSSMNAGFTRSCVAMVLAAPMMLAVSNNVFAESKLPQPDPAGSVLYGRLSDINDNGAYFANTPYTEGASRAVGQLVIGGGICSGSVINTSTKNIVITAAHCVGGFSKGRWVVSDKVNDQLKKKESSFRPSVDGTKNNNAEKRPLGSWVVKNAYTLPDSYVDVAILEVYPDDKGQQIQDAIGGGYDVHAPIAAGDKVQASLVGYPGPAPFNAKSQSVCVGNYTYHPGKGNSEISRVSGEKECWVGGGSSGGPYLTQGKTPDSPKQVLTVLNSNGGGNVPAVIDELLKLAGATRN